MCALDQDKFFEYRHALFENFGNNNNLLAVLDVAAGIEGLDSNQISECISSGKYKPLIAEAQRAATAWQISATPTFVINGRRVEGNQPYSQLRQIIDQELAAVE